MKEKNTGFSAEYVDNRLQRRLRIYLFFIFIFLVVLIIEVSTGMFKLSLAIIGVLIGFVVGIFTSRMYHLSWDDENNLVIGHIDKIGFVILICYMIFIFTRTFYLHQWIHGSPLMVMLLSLTTGTMLGNLMNTQRSIKKILKTLNILV
jgi:uncharacterized membrane protein